MRQQVRRDAYVVVDDLGFGEAVPRIQDRFEIGDTDGAVADLEVLLILLRGGASLGHVHTVEAAGRGVVSARIKAGIGIRETLPPFLVGSWFVPATTWNQPGTGRVRRVLVSEVLRQYTRPMAEFRFPEEIVRDVTDTVVGRVTESIGVARQDMDEAMQTEINSTVQATLSKKFANEVISAAESQVGRRAIGGTDIAGAITSKLAVGKRAIEAMVATSELDDILEKNAQLLKKKYDALVTAGFTDDQAFRLLEAEIFSKGAGRPR
jgi:hypothetical protein